MATTNEVIGLPHGRSTARATSRTADERLTRGKPYEISLVPSALITD